MSFTYDVTTPLGRVRFLVADTVDSGHIYEDDELLMALQVESSQGLYVSGPGASGTASVPVIPQVYSVHRAAAMALDSLASNSARLSNVTKLLDVELSVGSAAKELRGQADGYRKIEARRGSFAIAEMVVDQFSAVERMWKQYQRQGG